MSGTETFLTIIGGVALLLYGVQQVRYGVTRAFGVALRQIIERSTRTKIGGFISGIFVTALVQSSTATSLILTSFASKGMISVAAALAVVLGADVGTTLIAQIFTFDIGWLAPCLIALGVIGYGIKKTGPAHMISIALIGLGLMLLSLSLIVTAATPFGQSDLLKSVMVALGNEPALAFLLAILLTWMAHSSLAIVLLVMSLAGAGAITVPVALVFVLGANVGGTIPPLLLNLREGGNGRVVAFGSFFMRLIGALVTVPFVYYCADWMGQISIDPQRQVVNFHTSFNLIRGLAFLPFTGFIAHHLTKMIPLMIESNQDEGQAKYLDYQAIETPVVALSSAARETLRMADIVKRMLDQSIHIFTKEDAQAIKKLQREDDFVDRLYEQIKLYMARLSGEALDPEQSKRYMQVLMFATNLEHIGDILDKNLCELANKRLRGNIAFSDEGLDEIKKTHARIVENFKLGVDTFMTGDPALARQLIKNKEINQQESITSSDSHFKRIRAGLQKTLQSSSLHLDILRDFQRINSHITAGAYSILEERGDLQSRIKS